jgi:hypothetical protein
MAMVDMFTTIKASRRDQRSVDGPLVTESRCEESIFWWIPRSIGAPVGCSGRTPEEDEDDDDDDRDDDDCQAVDQEDDVHRRMINGATASLSLRTNSSDKPLTRLYRSSGGSGGGYDREDELICTDERSTITPRMTALHSSW